MKQIFFTILITLLFSVSVIASPDKTRFDDLQGVLYQSTHDGDTIRFNIPNTHPLFGHNIPIRLRGIDTPEINSSCPSERQHAIAARQHVHTLLHNAHTITLKRVGRGKYFRILGDVVFDGVDLGQHLLQNGWAVSYDGDQKKSVWCDSIVNE
ncbi:MAG: thermonuclease family protein [Magnetococcales bacterium]|nr:thermonuclease family protein [Magnetococcales bacterium]